MKARVVGSLLLGVALVFSAHQRLTSAEHTAGDTGLAAGPQQRPDAFIPGVPSVVSSPLKLAKAIPIPGLTLGAVDIFWVEESTQRLYFADRTNGSVDIIDTSTDTFVTRVPGFGPPTGAGNGPNGVQWVPGNKLWVGDGPSRVRVIDLNLNPPSIIQTIDTGGALRADELAYDPADHILMIGNDNDTPPFLTFISTDTYAILGKLVMNDATGLEQPVWDPQLNRILLNVPNYTDLKGAGIAVINPVTRTIDTTYRMPGCNGSGLALGPFQRLLVACQKPIIINAVNGNIINTITQVNSGDQVWYNSGDGQFYVTSTDANGSPVLGVIDAETATWKQNVPVGRAIRNVSAFAGNNHVYVSSVAPPAGTPDTSACASLGFVGVGCIAVFTH